MSKSRKSRNRKRSNPFVKRRKLSSVLKPKSLAGKFAQAFIGFALGVFVCVAAWKMLFPGETNANTSADPTAKQEPETNPSSELPLGQDATPDALAFRWWN